MVRLREHGERPVAVPGFVLGLVDLVAVAACSARRAIAVASSATTAAAPSRVVKVVKCAGRLAIGECLRGGRIGRGRIDDCPADPPDSERHTHLRDAK